MSNHRPTIDVPFNAICRDYRWASNQFPFAEVDGMPVGLSPLGARGMGEMLIALARKIGAKTGPWIYAKVIISLGAAAMAISPTEGRPA